MVNKNLLIIEETVKLIRKVRSLSRSQEEIYLQTWRHEAAGRLSAICSESPELTELVSGFRNVPFNPFYPENPSSIYGHDRDAEIRSHYHALDDYFRNGMSEEEYVACEMADEFLDDLELHLLKVIEHVTKVNHLAILNMPSDLRFIEDIWTRTFLEDILGTAFATGMTRSNRTAIVLLAAFIEGLLKNTLVPILGLRGRISLAELIDTCDEQLSLKQLEASMLESIREIKDIRNSFMHADVKERNLLDRVETDGFRRYWDATQDLVGQMERYVQIKGHLP